jgi:protein-tyrosine phosphatase
VTAVAVRLVGTFIVLLVLGNLLIMAASWVAGATTPTPQAAPVAGVHNLQAVDERVWRGAAPTAEGYQGLAEAGVTTVVDLRAEDGVAENARQVEALGMRYVHMPIRDGQVPKGDQVAAFLKTVEDAQGRVFVHCGAGVGRTGAMAGAYLVAAGEGNHNLALRRNLAVGPPSLEQIAYVNSLDREGADRPGAVVTMASRVLDFPRRAWHVIGG